MPIISEDNIEQLIIEEFLALGYSHVHGTDISPDGSAAERG